MQCGFHNEDYLEAFKKVRHTQKTIEYKMPMVFDFFNLATDIEFRLNQFINKWNDIPCFRPQVCDISTIEIVGKKQFYNSYD